MKIMCSLKLVQHIGQISKLVPFSINSKFAEKLKMWTILLTLSNKAVQPPVRQKIKLVVIKLDKKKI